MGGQTGRPMFSTSRSMFRIVPFILFLLGGYGSLNAQPDQTYLRSIDPHAETSGLPFFDSSNNIKHIGGNVFVESGYVKVDGKRETRLLKIPLDTMKAVQQVAVIGPQDDISITKGVVTPDSCLLFTGEWADINQGLMRTLLIKYDTSLNVVWMTTFPELEDPDRRYYGTDVCITPSGDILMYGNYSRYENGDWQESECYVLKTDANGNLLWYKEIKDDYLQTLAYGNLTPIGDGHYLVSTLARYPLPTGNWMRVYYQYVKFDGDGNVLWKKVLTDSQSDDQLPFTAPTAKGGFVAAMPKDTFVVNKGPGPWRNLRWYSQDAVLEVEHHWDEFALNYGSNDLLEAENSDIVVVGVRRSDWGRGQSFIERYTAEGELLWERIYNDSLARPWPGAFLAFVSVTELDDHRLAITGIVTDSVDTVAHPNWPPLNFNVLFVVLDSLGCLESGCDGVLQVITSLDGFQELPPLDVSLLSMTPNPASGYVVVRLPEQTRSHLDRGVLTCYDLQGRVVQTWPWPQNYLNRMDIDVTSLSMGNYVLVLTNGGYPVGSGKLIVQR